MDVYVAGESAARRPLVMVFTPIFGVDADMKAAADGFAQAGFLVAVPDYFHRIAPGPLDRSEEGRKQAFARWQKLDVAQAIEDLRPLRDRLLASPSCNGRWAALGWCAGGELAFLAGTRLGADLAAAFHGTRIDRHLGEATKLRGPVSLHYGGADPLVPMAEVDKVRQGLAGVAGAEVFVYEGAQHGFSFKGRPSYHEVAETRSRERVRGLLEALK